MNAIRLFIAAALGVIPLAAAPVALDTVKLSDGTVLQGRVIEETREEVTIEYEAGAGILDRQTIPMSEVALVERIAPDTAAFRQIEALLPTDDLMTVADYEKILSEQVGPFLQQHGDSHHAPDVKKMAAQLREERDRVAEGAVKLQGKWISADDYQQRRYWIDGVIALQKITEAAEMGQHAEALRRFNEIKEAYAGTTLLTTAARRALASLRAYRGQIDQAMRNLPILEEQRQRQLASLAGQERQRVEEEFMRERERYQRRAADEAASGIKWVTLDPYNMDALEKALKLAPEEEAELRELAATDFKAEEAILRNIDQALIEGRIDDAKNLIDDASTIRKLPYYKTLRTRIDAEKRRLKREAKLAKDEAKLAKQRAGAAAAQPQPQPQPDHGKAPKEPEAGEPEAEQAGAVEPEPGPEPVAAADPTPNPVPVTTPEGKGETPVADEPGEANEADEVPAPRKRDKSEDRQAAKESSSRNLSGMLWLVVGGLMVVLLVLLAIPGLKKKEDGRQKQKDEAPKREE